MAEGSIAADELRLLIERIERLEEEKKAIADDVKDVYGEAKAGGYAENYEELRYEGFGPGGVALIVEALTDNRNRTATNVRTAFSKNGGNLGASGSVSHGFERLGLIAYPASAATPDEMLDAAIE